MLDSSSNSLPRIHAELKNSLVDARHALEQFAEDNDNKDALSRCMASITSVRGALRIIEVDGAAMLASEVLRLLRTFDQQRVPHPDDGLESLSRALVQLPVYLDRVAKTGRDIPLVVLPLVNDLRAARGATLMSEDTVFVLNFVGEVKSMPTVNEREGQPSIQAVSERLRPNFQSSLLGLVKAEKVSSNLATMGQVANRLSQAARHASVYQLFWVAEAMIEALREEGVTLTGAIKRLLGQLDIHMKSLAENGEMALSSDPPTDLLNSMLYYVARSHSKGDRVDEVRRSFALDGQLPEAGEILSERKNLAGPSDEMLQTVAHAIEFDLSQVKDALDLFVRGNNQNVNELAPQVDTLNRLANTLALLGLPDLKAKLIDYRNQLNQLLSNEAADVVAEINELAEGLLGAEQQLNRSLHQWLMPDTTPPAGRSGTDQYALKEVEKAVLRECLQELGRVQAAMQISLADPNQRQELDRVPARFHSIYAALTVMGNPAAARVALDLQKFVQPNFCESDTPLAGADLSALAAVIVGLEAALASQFRTGKHDRMYLPAAARALDDLIRRYPDAGVTLVGDAALAAKELAAQEKAETSDTAGTNVLAFQAPRQEQLAVDWSTPVSMPEDEPAALEGLELFIEEARDLIEAMTPSIQQWVAAPDDFDALGDIRRAFHTLKGSGHMVGAIPISEFSREVEDLLNRVLVKTIPPVPEVVLALKKSFEALGELVEQLEIGTTPEVDVPALIYQLQALTVQKTQPLPEPLREPSPKTSPEASLKSSSKSSQEPLPEPSVPATLPATLQESLQETSSKPLPPPEAPAQEPPVTTEDAVAIDVATPAESEPLETVTASTKDPVLYEIFCNEADQHLEALRAYVKAHPPSLESAGVSEPVERALHTLRGSATMAKIMPIASIVEPFHKLVQAKFRQTENLNRNELNALSDTVAWLDSVIDPVTLPELERAPDHLVDVIAKLVAQLPAPDAITAGEHKQAAVTSTNVIQDELQALFADEARELLDQADQLIAGRSFDHLEAPQWKTLKRILHTLKGSARMVDALAVADLAHGLEAIFDKVSEDARYASVHKELIEFGFDRLNVVCEQLGQPGTPAASMETDTILVTQLHEAGESLLPPLPEVDSTADEMAVNDAKAASDESVASADATLQAADAARGMDLHGAKEVLRELSQELESVAQSMPTVPPTQSLSAAIDEDTEEGVSDYARIDRKLLDSLLSEAGEIGVVRGRLEQQISSVSGHLSELGRTVIRLREQLRVMEMETEARVAFNAVPNAISETEAAQTGGAAGFDPLEMDRYTRIQQLSRSLSESVTDLSSLQEILEQAVHQAENLLSEQSRVTAGVQDKLIQARMVPLSQFAPRLDRIVRQTARDSQKQVELRIEGDAQELDSQVMRRMLAPLEHMLRNAVVHGIETPAQREAAGKPAQGIIQIHLRRDRTEVIMRISDDGAGLNAEQIRQQAVVQGRIKPDSQLTEQQIFQLVMEPGLTTAKELTQIAGRGVGMDVVGSEVKQLGGRIEIRSEPGKGTEFILYLPVSLAVTQVLLVRVGVEVYGLPVSTVESVKRETPADLREKMQAADPTIQYGEDNYHLVHLGEWMSSPSPRWPVSSSQGMAVVSLNLADKPAAIIVDEMLGSREIVIKPLGSQLASVRGLSGATILSDGRVALVLDIGTLLLEPYATTVVEAPSVREVDDRPLVMVVDDSITVRRVTQRLLERHDLRVITAKDGADAVTLLQEHVPTLMLLDVEMPRMDGYEVAAHVRNHPTLNELPIIMITSRVGEKHRARAFEIGVDAYLGKPYQESQLLATMEPYLQESRALQSPSKTA